MKKIALMGAQGMLGQDLRKRLDPLYQCYAVDIDELDITQRDRVIRWVDELGPDLLINAAAYTNVDGCETHQDLAMEVNGEAPGYLAEACAKAQIPMVHISTDFIFDGSKGTPYVEDDSPNPLSVYGASKLLGEKRVAEHLDRFLIVRTSWLYGHGGKNFVEAILTKARAKENLRVVHDQVGSPTYVPDLSHALLRLLEADARGIVHVSNSGSCSWFEFAELIVELSGIHEISVTPIPSSELHQPARRPANSILLCERYRQITRDSMKPWEAGLKDYLKTS